MSQHASSDVLAPPPGSSEDALGRGYLTRLGEAFARASVSAGHLERRSFAVGGWGVSLEFAGETLVPMLWPAVRHLAGDGAEAKAVTVQVWDSASTDTPVPDFPWRRRDVVARGEVRPLTGSRVHTYYDLDADILTAFDAESRHAVFWTPTPDTLAWYHRAAPFRLILHWALMGEGRQLVHGGAVATQDGGLLLAGRGGSGKSTVAVACLEGGFDYLGDDYVVVSVADEPSVFSLYGTAKLAESALVRLPGLELAPGERAPRDGEKLVLDVYARRPGQIRTVARIRAIVLPKIVPGGPTRLRPASSGEALHALGPSTILQLPHRDAAAGSALSAFSTLVRQAPTYVLELGSDIRVVPAMLRDLLATVDPGRKADP